MFQPYYIKLKTAGKDRSRIPLAVSNVARSLFAAFYVLIINYLLLNYRSTEVLNAFVVCMSLANALMVLPNWGGKDLVQKLIAADPSSSPKTLAPLMGARILFSLLIAVVVLFFQLPISYKIFIPCMVLFRSVSSLTEALVIHRKKHVFFLSFDLLFYSVITLLLFSSQSRNNPVESVFSLLLIAECLRTLTGVWYFRSSLSVTFNPAKIKESLYRTKHFFLIALTGFISSRGDLYAVGLILDAGLMSTYYILLGMLSLSHIVYSTFVGTFASGILRYQEATFAKFSRDWTFHGFIYGIAAGSGIYLVSEGFYKLDLPIFLYPFIAANIFLFSLTLTQFYQLTRSNEQGHILRAMLAGSSCNLALCFILIPPFGLGGAFAGNTLGLLIIYIFLKARNHTWKK